MKKQTSERLSILFMLFIVGVVILYTKYSFLMSLGGWYMLAKGLTGLPSPDSLSIFQKISIFYNDILVSFIIIPFVFYLVSLFVTRNIFRYITLVFSLISICILYANLQSLEINGTFLNINLLFDAIQWGISDKSQIFIYISLSSLIKLIIILFTIVAIFLLSQKRKIIFLLSNLTISIIAISSLLYIVITIYPTQNHNLFKKPIWLYIMERMIPDKYIDLSKGPYRSYKELIDLNTNSSLKDRYFGSESSSDIILFVMETAPVAAIDFVQEANNLPGISKILNNLLLSSNHFTTYPYTRHALFSILTSMYPINIENRFLSKYNKIPSFGLMTLLKHKQYITEVYSPLWNYPFAEIPMFKLLGASKIYLSGERPYKKEICLKKANSIINSHSNINIDENRRKILINDLMAFEKFKDMIMSHKENNEKFLALFLPQLSHGPWISKNVNSKHAVLLIGHELILIQLEWLEELILQLREKDYFKNTVILVTTDHGLRTKNEFPYLPLGKVNEYSFNVPFALYAPNTFSQTIINQYFTSHIDIMPTLLYLLGIENNEQLQGINMLAKSNRKIFFIARNYFSSDGYWDGYYFYAYNYLHDIAFKAKDMHFINAPIVSTEEKQTIKHELQLLYAITNRWR